MSADVTRAWVSAWVIHRDHPELAASAVVLLPTTCDADRAYRQAIDEGLPAAFARRMRLENRGPSH